MVHGGAWGNRAVLEFLELVTTAVVLGEPGHQSLVGHKPATDGLGGLPLAGVRQQPQVPRQGVLRINQDGPGQMLHSFGIEAVLLAPESDPDVRRGVATGTGLHDLVRLQVGSSCCVSPSRRLVRAYQARRRSEESRT